MAFRFEKLDVWKEAINFSQKIYEIAKLFPKEELYALGDQLRRSAVSISANIAEGSGSDSDKDFRNFLSIALKSLHEVVSLLAVAEKNGYITEKIFTEIRDSAELLAKRIQALRNSLRP